VAGDNRKDRLMAKYIIDDPVVTIDGDDFSDHMREATIEASFAEVDLTAFGADFSEMGVGLGTATMTFEAFQDYASNSIDQNLWPIFVNKTAVTITVKPANTTTSATNPKYTMTGRLTTYNPVGGAKGDASMVTLTFVNASQTGIVRSFT
jgi:hypothetical protein